MNQQYKLLVSALFATFAALFSPAREPASSMITDDEALSAAEIGYAVLWAALQLEPPKLDKIDGQSLADKLNGRYTYEYVDLEAEEVIKGEFSVQYPRFSWPSDGGKGTLRLAGNKILLFDDAGEIRTLIVRIRDRFYLLLLDFPDGKVELVRSVANSKL